MPHPGEVATPAYKKALRNARKSKRTIASDTHATIRLQEKTFKARFPPPDLSGVLDLAALSEDRREEYESSVWKGSPDSVPINEVDCGPLSDRHPKRRAYCLTSLPGLVLLPSFLTPVEQRALVRNALKDHAKTPNENNLDTHYILPRHGLWNTFVEWKAAKEHTAEPIVTTKAPKDTSVAPEDTSGPRPLIDNVPASPETFAEMQAQPKLPPAPSTSLTPLPISSILPKLRWSNIGHFYHWGTKSYEFEREHIPIPQDIETVCRAAVDSVNWEEVWRDDMDLQSGDWGSSGPDWRDWSKTFRPDAGIINFYQLRDTLMAHVDRSELSSTSPLVSISLGQSAVFLIGGLDRDEKATPILLRSGDVVIMSGPRCRRAYHGVPRILEGTLPAHLRASSVPAEEGDWSLFEEYLSTTRININVRQVFPPDFDYTAHGLERLKPTGKDVMKES